MREDYALCWGTTRNVSQKFGNKRKSLGEIRAIIPSVNMKTTVLQRYRGNKDINGLWQFIINRIPPHDIFFELFAGSAAISRRLVRSYKVINDCNAKTVSELKKELSSITGEFICADALQLLSSLTARDTSPWVLQIFRTVSAAAGIVESICTSGSTDENNYGVLNMIYLDPPYLFSSRRSGKKIYDYEMTDKQHEQLLIICSKVKDNCMISHPENKLYDKYLKGWTKEKFKVCYHGKVFEECIYYNYQKPDILHTYQYVGSDCWDRQRVKRKIDRLVLKLKNLPALERNAVIERVFKKLI